MRKKILVCVLAFVLSFQMSVCAFAKGKENAKISNNDVNSNANITNINGQLILANTEKAADGTTIVETISNSSSDAIASINNNGISANGSEVATIKKDSTVHPAFSTDYSPTPFSGEDYDYYVFDHESKGNIRLNNAISEMTVSGLVSLILWLLPIPTIAKVIAQEIITGVTAYYANSTCIYYKEEVYRMDGVLASMYSKVTDNWYYDRYYSKYIDTSKYFTARD